jgi:integration host factor subunit beta
VVKSELIRALSEKLPELAAKDVELAVNCVLEQMIAAQENGERIEVRGFGSFSLHHLAARVGRNPKTGEAVQLPKKVALHFKPGKELKDRVDAVSSKYRITD